MIRWLRSRRDPLPDAAEALGDDSDAPGLVAVGGDLEPTRLAEAYGKGIFPWFSEGQPVLWWSPDPRMVLLPAEFSLKRSLRKTIARFARTPGSQVRVDHAFRTVMERCAGVPRRGQVGTWIVPAMVDAYVDWHARGATHSFETWVDGALVGGLYGVCLGRMFFGESMFAEATDASKIALAALVAFCRAHGIETIDCQQRTSHLAGLGAREIPRHEFIRRVGEAIAKAPVADWSYDARLWREIGIEPATTPGAAPPPDVSPGPVP